MSNINASNENQTKTYWLNTKFGSGLVIVVNDIIYRTPINLQKWKGKLLETVVKILKNKRELVELQELVPEEIPNNIDEIIEDDNI